MKVFLIASEFLRQGIPDKLHLGIGQGFLPCNLIAVHLSFLMHDADDHLAGKFGQEHAFLYGRVTGTNDHYGFTCVGSRVTGCAEGNSLVIEEFVLTRRPCKPWFSAAGNDDAAAFIVGAEGFHHLSVPFQLYGAHIGELKFYAEFFSLLVEQLHQAKAGAALGKSRIVFNLIGVCGQSAYQRFFNYQGL